MEKKTLLLISYVFPPYYGIGGRRWAKHAAELSRLGYTVHVICAENAFRKTSLWFEEVRKEPGIVIHILPNRYPDVLVNYDHTSFEKAEYKLWEKILPLITKGSIYDRSAFWKKTMLAKASELVEKHNIKNVVAAGGPFSTLFFSTELKKKFKNLFLLCDFRDPWTWGPNWGYSNLTPERMQYEKELERRTIEKADLISVPSEDMKDHLCHNYPEFKNKFVRIPHFFDPEEVSPQNKTTSDKIRFVMYGNIYQDMNAYLEKTAEVFAKHKDRISLDIYTDKLHHKGIFENKGASNVSFHPPVNAYDLFSGFSNFDFVYLLNPPYNKNNISTKFYEIIQSHTPLFLVSENGKGPQFIEENKLGICSALDKLPEKMKELISNGGKTDYNNTFDVSEFSLHNVTLKILELLKPHVPEPAHI
jgi:hypothetical protein